jgi:hypothetical protein
MKKHNLLILLFSLAFLVFLYGVFADRETAKLCMLALAGLGLVTLVVSGLRMDFLDKPTKKLFLASAVSKAFVFLVILLYLLMMWGAFISPLPNSDFSIFGSLFLALLLVQFFNFQELENYVGKKL